jgi:membrane fusion protein, copper/silver efflux system
METAAVEEAIYRCPMHPTLIAEREGECPVCGMDLVKDASAQTTSSAGGERKIAYWRAPMDPSYTADQPGKSPMGMDLLAVYADELGAEGMVQIDPVTVQNIEVKTELVERRALSRTVRTVGRVDYDETRMTDVNTKIDGWVEKLHVAATGQEVKKANYCWNCIARNSSPRRKDI